MVTYMTSVRQPLRGHLPSASPRTLTCLASLRCGYGRHTICILLICSGGICLGTRNQRTTNRNASSRNLLASIFGVRVLKIAMVLIAILQACSRSFHRYFVRLVIPWPRGSMSGSTLLCDVLFSKYSVLSAGPWLGGNFNYAMLTFAPSNPLSSVRGCRLQVVRSTHPT